MQESPPDPRAVYVIARMGPAGVPLLNAALTNEMLAVRLQARLCLEMVRTNGVLLCGESGVGPAPGTFARRLTEMNLLTLKASWAERAARDPGMFGGWDGTGRPVPVVPGEWEEGKR